ncbi:MAG: hypothetical protein GY822_31115 [Deltaproteobacteria bacterium]|nr:hypothetical protein [Deltaproteobacteria bacterium]
MGDANPGIIVSTSPLLLAVRTDLRKGPNLCFPVLKIVPSSKARCWGPAPQEGQRVVTVALYSEHLGEQRPPYWLDFDPISPEPYVDSFLETNGLLNSFGDDEWDALEQGILEMNSKWIPGLHRLEQESTDWKTHPPLGSGV